MQEQTTAETTAGTEDSNIPACAMESTRRKTAAARLSVGCTALLVVLKLVVGIGTGSVGILSEAAHSATDLLAACLAYLAVRISDKPPDDDHPYGHGKVESISSLIEALLIFVAVFFICWESVNKLRDSAPDSPTSSIGKIGLGVMLFSAFVNFLVSRHLLKVARATDSLALEADAKHLRTDIVTSLGVAVGLLLVLMTGRAWFDPLSALCVSLLILSTGIRLMGDALHPLLDTRLPVEEVAAIQEILETHEGVLSYHKLRTRKAGSQRHADVHVQIDDHTSLIEAHALTEAVEDRIRATLPNILINIHIEPYHEELKHQGSGR